MQASVSLGLDNSPFDKAINQAQTKAESFASKLGRLLGGGGGAGKTPWEEFIAPIPGAKNKVEGLSASLANLFKRTPDRRAEVALSQFASNLVSGDVAGAITSLGLRMTGFGLVAGVAVGAAIETFNRFRQQVADSDGAVRNLAETLGTFSNTGGRSVEALTSHFKEVSSSVGTALEKTDSWGAKAARIFDDLGSIGALSPEEARNPRRSREQAQIRAGIEEEVNTLKRRNAAEFEAVAVRDETLNISERQGGLDKIALEAAEKRAQVQDEQRKALSDVAKLSEKGLLPEGKIPELIKAINESAKKRQQDITADAKVTSDQFEKQADLKKHEADVEGMVLALNNKGLAVEEATTKETQTRIALLRGQLGLVPIEQKQGIQDQITKLKQKLPPDLRTPIGISGETSQGILDQMTGEFRNQLRPQEQANLRAGQAEAQARLRDDLSKYQSDMIGFNARNADYMRGADYYSKEQLKRPTAPTGYDVNATTGKVTKRDGSGKEPETPITTERLESILFELLLKSDRANRDTMAEFFGR